MRFVKILLLLILLFSFAYPVLGVNDSLSVSYSYDTNANYLQSGHKCIANSDRLITGVDKDSGDSGENILIYNVSETSGDRQDGLIYNSSIVGVHADISDLKVLKGLAYYIVVQRSGGSRTMAYKFNNPSLPYNKVGFNCTHRAEYSGGWLPDALHSYAIQSIQSEDLPSAIYGMANISVFNSSNDETFNLGEGENFRIEVNLTTTEGVNINDSNCSFKLDRGLVEVDGDGLNFSLANNGADFDVYSSSFAVGLLDNQSTQYLHFYACHVSGINTYDLSVSFCGADVVNIDHTLFPICSEGVGFIFVGSDACLNKTYANITIDNDAPVLNKGAQIWGVDWDTEYTKLILEQNRGLYFNDSLKKYVSNQSIEYYVHDIYELEVSCINDDPDLSVYEVVNLTIENNPPQIFLEFVSTGITSFSFSDTQVIEYENTGGNWSFNWTLGVFIDDNDVNYTIGTLRNQSDIICNRSGYQLECDSFEAETFLFPNALYNLSVYAEDEGGLNDWESINFSVNDTTFPVCYGLENISFPVVSLPKLYTFNITCLDYSGSNFSIICDDLYFSNQSDFLNYFWDNQSIVYNDSSCFVRACDYWDNCYTGVMSLNFTGEMPVYDAWNEGVSWNLQNTLINIFLLVFWVALVVLTLNTRGNRGNIIQFFNILQLVTGFVAGTIWFKAYFIIGFPIILIAVGFFIGFIMDNKK